MIAHLRALWREPLGKILALALLVRLPGLAWGLPASDGWDDDGVAPRDFLIGVVFSYWPGHHYIYPPLHLVLLTLVSLPIWIPVVLGAHSLSPAALVQTFIQVPIMTALAILARAVTAALSVWILWNLAKIGEALGGSRRAGAWVAACCACNAVFTYYSQTTNLDVPYLFWAVLALSAFVRAVVEGQPRRLRHVGVLAALAVATKDQAYALFLLGIPLGWAGWLSLDRQARREAGAITKELAIGAGAGALLLLAVDGAAINPSGFADRLRLLLGPASQDHAYYPKTLAGRSLACWDTLRHFNEYYPWLFAPFVIAGLLLALRAPNPARRAAGLLPFGAALSFTVAFNMAARRAEHRFVLPQMLMWGVYAGLAFDALQTRLARLPSWSRPVPWLVAAACLGAAFFRCAAVDAAMLFDPRYDAERWLGQRVAPGDHVEVYGNNAHLPRFGPGPVVQRVDPAPLEGRSPLPGVMEVSEPFSEIESRKPRYIVASEFWVGKYLLDPAVAHSHGYVLSPAGAKLEADRDSSDYFHALWAGRLEYRLAHVSTWELPELPRIDIHESLARDIWIFERGSPGGTASR